jgi:hypothetical protein
MIDKKSISKRYLPESFQEIYEVADAYVSKVGFIPSNIKEERFEEVWGENSNVGDSIKEYIENLYSLFTSSPYVMDVTPLKEEFLRGYEKGDFGVTVWPTHSTIFVDFINLRMVMPKRKREELGLFSSSWSPEEFNIAFNGSLFLTYAKADKVPVYTDLGQIAREYLKNLMSSSSFVDPFDGVGPTPIHPEIYIIKLRRVSDENVDQKYKIPAVNYTDNNVVILIPEEDELQEVLDALLHDIRFCIGSFYSQRLMDRDLYDEIEVLEEMNESLSGKLSDYFELTLFQRFFSKNPKEIRSLLASMHLCLQRITSARFHAQRKRDDAINGIENSIFFSGLEKYFDEHMKDEHNFDRESQLTSMNFAADETGNFVLTQATLIAALCGALIGGAITAISQYFTNGGGS